MDVPEPVLERAPMDNVLYLLKRVNVYLENVLWFFFFFNYNT